MRLLLGAVADETLLQLPGAAGGNAAGAGKHRGGQEISIAVEYELRSPAADQRLQAGPRPAGEQIVIMRTVLREHPVPLLHLVEQADELSFVAAAEMHEERQIA